MKTLILFGSPRKNGDTAALLGALTRNLPGETMTVRAYDGGISPCVDCRVCWKRPGCAINDGMTGVYDYLAVCRNIVIASPVYFSQLTGPLLSLCSRLQTYYAARAMRGEPCALPPKKGALLLAGGGDGSHKAAVDTARCLFRLMNADLTATAYSLNTNSIPAAQDAAALNAAANAGIALGAGLS